MRIAAAATAGVLLCGCALFSARPPQSDRSVGELPICNPGKGAVGVDATFSVLLGIGFLALAAESETGPALGMAIGSAIYGGSAAYGNKSANRCKAELAAVELERRSGGWAERLHEDGDDAAAPMVAETEAEPAAVTTTMAETEPETAAETEPEAEAEAEPEWRDEARWSDFWKEVAR